MDIETEKPPSRELLVLDSSTFIGESGLTSRHATALRHYLHARGTQLAVPQVVVEECEKNLRQRVVGKVKSVQAGLGWLSRFCGGVNGWTPPQDDDIANRIHDLSRGRAFEAVVLADTPRLKRLAEERHRVQRPPSHKKDSLQDCLIWEHCLELLKSHDVIFVSDDEDFRGHGQSKELHPQLRSEADAVADGTLTFHRGMEPLMSELRVEVRHLPSEIVFAFVYEAIADEARELEANSGGWRPTVSGSLEQQMFTTDDADLVEVRLKVKDQWRRGDKEHVLEFRLSGSCQCRLSDGKLSDLSVKNCGLYTTQADGTQRPVSGPYANAAVDFRGGAPPMRPDPVPIGGDA